MCGIVGVYNFRKKEPVDKNILKKMTDVIAHRGPDGYGYYCDDENGLAFGHRRLSIIDIEGGHQPMLSRDNNFALTFNGEIYNYRELRSDLEKDGVKFSTTSDTEVLLTSLQKYGADTMSSLNGIFAFGIWDKNKKELLVTRDHLGVKPLYYYCKDGVFIFASEIKSILQHPSYSLRIDEKTIDIFLTFKHAPAPATLFKDIFILPPGSFIRVNPQGAEEYKFYWDTASKINYSMKEKDWIELLADATEKAVERQMVSDVPISISLSGGVDSNMLLSISSKKLKSKIASFTIGFTENEKDDEVSLALEAENYFNTKVITRILSAEDYKDWFSSYMWHLEEPVGNEPALAYYSVAKLAQDNKIKVLLSGQGADELFAGYPRYIGEKYHMLFPSFSKFIVKPLSHRVNNEQIRRSLYSLPERDELLRFYYIYSVFLPEEKKKLYKDSYLNSIDINAGINSLSPYFERFSNHNSLDKMLHIDTRFSLSDNLLLAGDKMSMAASVEARVPFLDIEYVKLVESIPAKFKINGLNIKYIHKLNAKKFLPDTIINRKKIGFTNPMDKWLVNNLRQDFDEMMDDENSIINMYFNKKYLNEMYDNHRNGKVDYKRHLFLIYSLNAWYKTFFK